MTSWLLMVSARVEAMVLEIEARRRALDLRGPRHQWSLMLILSFVVVTLLPSFSSLLLSTDLDPPLRLGSEVSTGSPRLVSEVSTDLDPPLLLGSEVSAGLPRSNRGTVPRFRSVRPS